MTANLRVNPTLDTHIRRTVEQFVAESPDQDRYLFGWKPDYNPIDLADFLP